MSARRHFGSVRRLPSGRYQASYWHHGERHNAPDTFAAKADALAHLSCIEADIRRGAWLDPMAGSITLAAYAARWLANRPELRPRTVELYRYLLDSHVLATLGTKTMTELASSDVRGWYAGLSARHPSTAAKAYRLLAAICRTAVTDEAILRSPCRVEGAGVEHAPERPTASVAEVEALADAMPERWRLLVLLGAWCGLRRGELLGLRRRDLDLLRATVRVERAYSQLQDGRIIIGPPKTEAGRRAVSIPPHLIPEVSAHLDAHVGAGPDELVFTGEKGGPLRPATLHKHWTRARLSIGRPDLHLHDLRHAGNTWAAATGASTRELMARMGHASSAAALHYQHATAERDAALAAALSELRRPAPVVALDGCRNASAEA